MLLYRLIEEVADTGADADLTDIKEAKNAVKSPMNSAPKQSKKIRREKKAIKIDRK